MNKLKKLIFLVIFAFSLFGVSEIQAQTGCCIGSVHSGIAECPNNPDPLNWFCTNQTLRYSCSGMDYSTCINNDNRPTSSTQVTCGDPVERCTGCGWSASCNTGGGGGGAYTPPTCASGKALTAYSPMGTLDNNACRFQGTCGNLFPSSHTMTGCDNVVTKGNCSVSYMCCSPGQTINCTGTTVTRVGNCNADTEVKLSSATYVIGIDEAGKAIKEIRSVCKRGCSCVTPCNPSSPSAPVPTFPANGATTANTTPALMWDRTAQTWGTG